MRTAKMKLKLSSCDQVNLEKLINQWKEKWPGDNFYYRKFHSTEEETYNFLYVHQTEWQRHLLEKYGNDLVLLDATYKTSRYVLPLFFLCVKTNVNYQVVASFITHKETADDIAEALGIVKIWNPLWCPKNAMCDFSHEEINAIEAIFPGMLLLSVGS